MSSYLAILGGNLYALAAIEHLGQLGYRTLVLDRNPEAPARSICDSFLAVDFSNATATLAALSSVDLIGVMALNDFGVRTAARIVQERKLPGYSPEAARNVTNKVAMKGCWQQADLPMPRYAWLSKDDVLGGGRIDWDLFPCIMKPAFSGGGSRGVYVVHDHRQIRQRLIESERCYIDDELIIEEFIEGSEHTLEVLIHGGSTHILNSSDKRNYRGSRSVVQQLFFPGPISRRYRSRLETLLSQASAALGLTDGCAHYEVLVRDEEVFLLEVGGRPGGGLNFFPICRLATGYDYPLELARVLTDEAPSLARADDTVCLGWHYFDVPPGRLAAIVGFDRAAAHEAVVDACMFFRTGETLPPLTDDLARPGYLLIKGETFDEVEQLILQLDDMVTFEVEASIHATPSS